MLQLDSTGASLAIGTDLNVTSGILDQIGGATSIVGNAAISGGAALTASIGAGTFNSASLSITGGGTMLAVGTATVTLTSGAATIGAGAALTLAGGTLNAVAGGISDAGTLSGSGVVAGAIGGSDIVEASGGTLELTNAIGASSGVTYEIANIAGSELRLDGLVGGSDVLTFLGTAGTPTGELALAADGAFAGTISQLFVGASNTSPTSFIDIIGNNMLTVTGGLSGSGTTDTLTLSDGASLKLTNIVTGGHTWYVDWVRNGSDTEIFLSTNPCYAAGTRILTERGEIAVEDLVAGERVVTLVGGDHVLKPIKWVGRRRVDLRAHPRPETVMPVRIAAQAFDESMPHRDVVLSPDHAVFVEGLLIQARQLVNGTTIRQERDWTAVEYLHVELEQHGILMAEGLPAESYLDTGHYAGFFQNAAGVMRLDPDLLDDEALPSREAGSCAPLVWDAERVEPIWHRLAERAAALGRPVPTVDTAADPALRLVANHRELTPVYNEDGLHIFPVPRGADAVRIVSRSAAPTDTRPWLEDRRRLGVRVKRLVLRATNQVHDIPLDHPRLADGWWDVEQDGNGLRRWTGGDAVLPLPPVSGPAMLEIHLSDRMTYPISDSVERLVSRRAA